MFKNTILSVLAVISAIIGIIGAIISEIFAITYLIMQIINMCNGTIEVTFLGILLLVVIFIGRGFLSLIIFLVFMLLSMALLMGTSYRNWHYFIHRTR